MVLFQTYSFCTQFSLTCFLIDNLCLLLLFSRQSCFFNVRAMEIFNWAVACLNQWELTFLKYCLTGEIKNNLMLISLGYSLTIMWVTRGTTIVSTANNNGGEKRGLIQKQRLVIKPTSLPLSSKLLPWREACR